MSTIKTVITVSITKETKPIGEKGFATLLIVGPNPTFSDRAKFYTEDELSSLASDLTGGDTALEYVMAAKVFSQSPHINRVCIGKKAGGDANYTAAMNAILAFTQDFYGVVAATRTIAEQKLVADWVQANERVAVFYCPDANIVDQTLAADTTSLAKYLKTNTMDRCAAITGTSTETEDAKDAALLGLILTWTPGSYTAAHKSLIGCATSDFNATQTKNAHDKYCSTYETIGENNIVLFGWVGSGEYLDIPIFADWLVARISEAVLGVKIRNKKVPFIDGGITAIQNAISKVLQTGIDNKGISPLQFDKNTGEQLGGFYVTVPLAKDVSANDKANRKLTNVKFKAWLAGAIHTTAIEGTLTV